MPMDSVQEYTDLLGQEWLCLGSRDQKLHTVSNDRHTFFLLIIGRMPTVNGQQAGC